MANVVDIFALPVPRKRLAEYRRLSRGGGSSFDMKRMTVGVFETIVDVKA